MRFRSRAGHKALRDAVDTPGLRMTYCQGVLELMSPSREHELCKTSIARLVELYAFLRELPLNGYGSTTFRREAKERGVEPDECYRVGSVIRDGELPDSGCGVSPPLASGTTKSRG